MPVKAVWAQPCWPQKKDMMFLFLMPERLQDKYKSDLEKRGIEFEEGKHSEERILEADEVMKSPGIPEKSSLVKQIRSKGIPVISEIELAYRHKGESRILGITGSNGKTTTTSLTYHICKHGGLDCALVGNIGYSIARQVAEDPKEWYIAEISSFQLDDIQSIQTGYRHTDQYYRRPPGQI